VISTGLTPKRLIVEGEWDEPTKIHRIGPGQWLPVGRWVWDDHVSGTEGAGTRKGQVHGPLDWRVVALDAAGLLLFFIPGVIAFAVDFTNGTIYLPPEGYAQQNAGAGEREFVTVKLPEGPVTPSKLEAIVSEHAEREIQLTPGTYQTESLETIDDFWAATDRYREERTPG
jgi:hypothetical protein